jgi:hypothetical protein
VLPALEEHDGHPPREVPAAGLADDRIRLQVDEREQLVQRGRLERAQRLARQPLLHHEKPLLVELSLPEHERHRIAATREQRQRLGGPPASAAGEEPLARLHDHDAWITLGEPRAALVPNRAELLERPQ